jgi:hypothetical protein
LLLEVVLLVAKREVDPTSSFPRAPAARAHDSQQSTNVKMRLKRGEKYISMAKDNPEMAFDVVVDVGQARVLKGVQGVLVIGQPSGSQPQSSTQVPLLSPMLFFVTENFADSSRLSHFTMTARIIRR